MTDLSAIPAAIRDATNDYREAARLQDARAKEIAWYKRDAFTSQNDEWAGFNDELSAETLIEIWRSLILPAEEFKQRTEKAIIRLIERNAETHADIMEREHRL